MEEYEGYTDYPRAIEAAGRKFRRAMYIGIVAIVVFIGVAWLVRA